MAGRGTLSSTKRLAQLTAVIMMLLLAEVFGARLVRAEEAYDLVPAAVGEGQTTDAPPTDAGGEPSDAGAPSASEETDPSADGEAEGDALGDVPQDEATEPDPQTADLDDELTPQADGLVASGEWGECSWSIDDEGQLRIRPTDGVSGVLAESRGFNEDESLCFFPWYPYRDYVTAAVIEEGVSLVGDATGLFYDFASLEVVEALCDTSSVTGMEAMYHGCSSLYSIEDRSWDTSSARFMSFMFYGCSSLTELDLSGWDTSAVEGMNSMFYGCSSLTELDISSWDTSAVKIMNGTFRGCSSLTELDLSGWNTSSVTDMAYMFCDCSSLELLDLSGWDTSLVTYTEDMPSGCENMFSGCTALERWRIGSAYAIQSADMVPDATGSESAWWSHAEHQWLTKSQIVESRSIVPDIYTSSNEVALASGEWGGCSWQIDANGQLTIWPTDGVSGVLAESRGNSSRDDNLRFFPWYPYSEFIVTCTVEDGVILEGSLDGMFCGCLNLASLDVSDWDTSSVTSMKFMFERCSALTTLDVSNWDTSSVTSMFGMLQVCSSLTTIDVSNWGTSLVTDMSHLFAGCAALESLNITGWDVSKVTRMYGMFSGCSSLASLDLSSWTTSSVTDMGYMFSYCPSLASLDLSGWDTSSVENMNGMFCECTALESLKVGSGYVIQSADMLPDATNDEGTWWSHATQQWLTKDQIATTRSGVADTYTSYESIDPLGVWGGCSWEIDDNGQLRIWPTDGVSGVLAESRGDNDDESLCFFPWYVYRDRITAVAVEDGVSLEGSVSGMFNGCSALESLDLSSWDTSSVTNMSHMFRDCSSLTSLDLSSWDTSSVTSMVCMFCGCSSLTSLDVSSWDTSSVIYMSHMFRDCSSLTSLDLSSWDTSSVTSMLCMFSSCSSLTSLDISDWDTSSVEEMGWMFYWCYRLPSLDVSSWDTSSVHNMLGMFNTCHTLPALDLSGWDTSAATGMYDMFRDCSSLTSIVVGGGWSTERVKPKIGIGGNNMFLNCTSLVGGSGTAYDSSFTNEEYARVDAPDVPGYLTAANIVGAEVAGVEDQTYTGSELMPVPTSVKVSGRALAPDTDYTLSYSNNTNAGTATITLTGTGSYTGERSIEFAIKPAAQTVTASNKSVAMGKTVSLGAKASAGGELTYKSANTAVAKVSATGVVTPVKPGTVKVTITAAATANYNSASKTVTVTVTKGTQTVTASNKTVAVGKTVSLGAKASAGGKLTYKSANTAVATVSSTGVVTPVKPGTVKVIITAAATANYNSASKVVTVTVTKGTQTVTASNKTVAVGKTVSLGAKASAGGKLTYKSANTAIAKVSATGVVTPIKPGTVKITITAAATAKYNSASKVVTVTVTKGTQTVTASNKSVAVGKTVSLGAKASAGGKLTYKSANTAIATVSATGVVSGKKAGTVKITITAAATAKYNSASKTVTVTVTAPQTGISRTTAVEDRSQT